MGLLERLASAVVGGAFGYWFAVVKIGELLHHPFLREPIAMVPDQYILYLGVGLFALAGFELGRLGLRVVIIVFLVFFLLEFFFPKGSEQIVRLYLASLGISILLALSSFRALLPSGVIWPMR